MILLSSHLQTMKSKAKELTPTPQPGQNNAHARTQPYHSDLGRFSCVSVYLDYWHFDTKKTILTRVRGGMGFFFESSIRYFKNDNILLTRRGRINSHFKKRTSGHSFMPLNRARNMLAADWLSQTHMKNYRNVSRVVIRLFSVVEISIKRFSL